MEQEIHRGNWPNRRRTRELGNVPAQITWVHSKKKLVSDKRQTQQEKIQEKIPVMPNHFPTFCSFALDLDCK